MLSVIMLSVAAPFRRVRELLKNPECMESNVECMHVCIFHPSQVPISGKEHLTKIEQTLGSVKDIRY